MKLGNITFDCEDVLRVAEFWSAVLEKPIDPRAGEWFASIDGSDPDRTRPAWYFSKVPETKQVKNRIHVDLVAPEPDAVDRLVALGATVVGTHEVADGSHTWTVMQDPEGNEFCIADRSFTGPS